MPAASTSGVLSRLLEREPELREIDAALSSAGEGRGRLLVISGQFGAGKTSLLREATHRAAQRGLAVAEAAGHELERDFAGGVAIQLFGPLLAGPQREDLLTGPAALAAPLLDQAIPGAPHGDGFPILHGLHWLTANLADQRPLLLAVDDAHWADDLSLRFLGYLAKRLEDLPVSVVVAARAAQPGSPQDLLAALRGAGVVLSPASLSPLAVRTVVLDRFPEAEEDFAGACASASGGNPFLLDELLHALEREGLAPARGATDRVRRLAPEAVLRLVRDRLAALSREARDLAGAVAVAGEPAPLGRAGSLVELAPEAAAAAADELAAANVLRAGIPLRFIHPMVGTAVAEAAPAAWSAAAHLRLARALRDDGAPAGEVAGHLLHAPRTGQAWVVALLREAAAAAAAAGAHETASSLLQRALDEPPGRADRGPLLLELGRAQARTGDPAAADTLRAGLDAATGLRERAKVALELGATLRQVGEEAMAAEVLDRAVDELGAPETALGRELEAAYLTAAFFVSERRDDVWSRLGRLLSRPPGADSVAERVLLAMAAAAGIAMMARRDEPLALADRALAGPSLVSLETSDGVGASFAHIALALGGRLHDAARLTDELLEDARRRGSLTGFATASHFRAQAYYRMGRLDEALADAGAALGAVAAGARIPEVVTRATLALIRIERGELRQAEAALARIPAEVEAAEQINAVFRHDASARLLLAQRRPAEAIGEWEHCARLMERAGWEAPSAVDWRSGIALGLVMLGRDEEALVLADEAVQRARTFGEPRALGIALRAAALAAPAERRLPGLEEAVAMLRGSESELELARALVDLGRAQRHGRAVRQARETLAAALDISRRCGGAALEREARDELLAAGARPRRDARTGVEALTPSERRVAGLAARGQTNREIAQYLFVTTKTVEKHLGAAYAKLGISGRDDLAAAMGLAPKHER